MYINSLSPELDEMLAYDNTNDIVQMEISDATMLKEYFTEKVVKMLLDKQRLLVVTPDSMDPAIPAKILSQSNLAHFTNICDASGQSPDILERVRSLTQLVEIPLLRQEYQHIILKHKELTNKIHNTLLSINKRSVKSPSFKEMLLGIKPRPKSDIPESLIEEISDININPRILKNINKLQAELQPRFIYMDTCVKMNPSCIEDKEALSLARFELADIKQEVSNALLGIERELFLMKRIISYELEDELTAWAKIKEELQNVFLENELDNYHSSFEENGVPIIEKFHGFKYLKLSVHIVPEMGWGQVSNILGVVNAVIDQAKLSTDTYFAEYVRKLSPFNTNNEELDAYINESIEALKRVNNCKYIDYKSPIQFLQVDALLNTLRSVSNEVNLCESGLTDTDYINFKRYVADLNISQNIINGLYNLKNESWSDVISFYGQRSHLMVNYSSNMNQLQDWYEELKSNSDLLRHTTHKEVHNRWCTARKEAITTLRNKQWDTFQYIIEGKGEALSAAEILKSIGSNIQDFFPVTVVSESDLNRVLSNSNYTFDDVFYLDHKRINSKGVISCLNRNVKVTCASTYTVDLSDLTDQYSVISNFNADTRIANNIQLNELEKSDRYKQALSLANNLITQVKSVSIYKMGSRVIITTLSPLLNKRINKLAKISINNVLYNETKEISHIVETLLHYDNIVLLIENDLLNDHNGMSTLWQHTVLRQLEGAGVNIFNLYTHELYQDLNGSINRLIAQVVPNSKVAKQSVELKEEQVALLT